jgi:hypothetical protein
MHVKTTLNRIGLILLVSFSSVTPQRVFAEKIELECRVSNLYLKSAEPSTEPESRKYIFDTSTEKLVENVEIYTDENGIIRGRANSFKTELASPSLIIATFREPSGGLTRVRINRINMEMQEVYYFPSDMKGAQPIYHKGACSMSKASNPKF